ncbi:hypothetical protein [Trinickia fusca]|uniref:DUF4148 domain-containing protein n=1 Tax=Trinickia fusca TaxID=2419777 RepID=A0A494XQF4_9BURK|nr:hypothetical protein [Trinickia fusca]RKP52857.1 hypothetical protein D7S89_03820 [Trinickia fusca]
MTVRAWPCLRARAAAVAIAGALAGTLGAIDAHAQPSMRSGVPEHPPHGRFLPPRSPRQAPVGAASVPVMRTAVPDFDEHQRDGHMTPEERRLLRQHIEDAVRELYKR